EETSKFSLLSSLRGEFKSEDFIQPHYKESYRLALDRLVSGGRDGYQEFLKGERIGSFLSEDELLFISQNVQHLPPQTHTEEINAPSETQSSSGTYWPIHSDVDTPDLDLGWPEVLHEMLQTNIDLFFHPPRQNSPTIKEVIRKHIQDARQVIAIVMDRFTDVDIFKEIVDASIRGVPVYVLLDDYHLKSFLTMAENQDVKLQQLRNMRVRTVKGQDYRCRSGAKFHGAMEQKFLLADCHTAIYGSYSFTWSFEKINLSMVQLITGHLVKSYDEEFRTLYARSTVPPELCPLEGLLQPHGPQILPKSHSAPKLVRRDKLRHSLDTVYRKTCERNLMPRDYEERLFEEEENTHRPLMENGFGVHEFQSVEEMNFLKRHSYAGERQDGYIPQNTRARGSNWNISRDPGNVTTNYAMDNYLQVPQMYRGQNFRQSYNGSDKQVLSMQQNMPTLENSSKSFMRTWRIESYLNNPDVPFGGSSDYLDQFEPGEHANFMQGRMRSSLALRPTPEQLEPNRYVNTSTSVGPSAAHNNALHYSSMQWNPTGAVDNRLKNEALMFQRQSVLLSNDFPNNAGYDAGRNSYHSYANLGQARGGQIITNPNILSDSWGKRHSVADPRSSTHESSNHMYGAFARMQVDQSNAGMNAQSAGHGSNLTEDQRSISHHDVKSMTSTKSPSAILDVKSKDLTDKSNRTGSSPLLKMSSKKTTSLLKIPEKKEDSVRNTKTPSLTSADSSDTITAEDEEKTSVVEQRHPQKTSIPVRSQSEHQRNKVEDLKLSKPKFQTEEQQQTLQSSLPKTTTQKKPSVLDKNVRPGLNSGSWSKERGAENRLYSRFEPFCSFEKKVPSNSFRNKHSQEKSKSLPKSEAAIEHNITRAARGHHENKLEKFFQRMGNLIHKNK
uniref:Family with sequence similarity 83 member B n=1 Tax=Amphilophus citrinellus TaxID=61819 RepID=A0A3Q0SK48_AMPCI